MALPTFVSAGSGAVATTTTLVTCSGPASGLQLNDMLLMHYLYDLTGGSDGPLASYTNMANLAGTTSSRTDLTTRDSGSMILAASVARYTGSGTPSFQFAGGTEGCDVYCRMYAFRGVSLGTTLAEVIESEGFGSGTSTTIADTGVTTTGPDRLAVQMISVNDDNAVGPMTGMTGGTWGEPVAEYATATGTDACIAINTADMAAAGTINGGTYVMVASDNWGVIGFAFKPVETYVPRNPAINHSNPGLLCKAHRAARRWRHGAHGILLPDTIFVNPATALAVA